MAPHSSTLAWKLPWTEEPGRLQSMGSQRVGHDWATSLSLFHFPELEKEMATHSSVLAWRIPGMGEPRGLLFMGSHRVGQDWSDFAAAAAAVVCIYQSSTPNLSLPQGFTKWLSGEESAYNAGDAALIAEESDTTTKQQKQPPFYGFLKTCMLLCFNICP